MANMNVSTDKANVKFVKDVGLTGYDEFSDERIGEILEEARKYHKNENIHILSHYFRMIEKVPLLSREEEVEFARRASQGDHEARRKLIVSNLRFVIRIAKQYHNVGIPLVDLISEGNVGLMIAVDRFDYTRGLHFISYAVWWIRQAILKYISERSKIVKFPMNRSNDLLKIEKFIREYEMNRGVSPTIGEISKAVSVKDEYIEILLSRRGKDYISFDEAICKSGEMKFDEIINVEDQSVPMVEEVIERNSVNEEVRGAIDLLPEREREIIKYRYGFYGKEHSLNEIGQRFNLTKERVRQIEIRALEKIREILKIRYPEIIQGN